MLLYDQLGDDQRSIIGNFGPKFDCTNVANYYFHHHKEYWIPERDFPWPRPPFENMWAEYKFPASTWSKEAGRVPMVRPDGLLPYFGCFVSSRRQFIAKEKSVFITDEAERPPGQFGMYGGTWYVDPHSGKPARYGRDVSMRFDIDEDGKISKYYFVPSIMGDTDEERASRAYFLHPILLAFSFSNCKNIEVVTVEPPPKLNKRRAERGKRPLVSYRIINVLPFGKTYKQVSRSVQSDGSGVAMHIRAGNFARYGEQHNRGKLFGKHEGMFWRPQSVVGSLDRGLAVHDYAAKGPKESE